MNALTVLLVVCLGLVGTRTPPLAKPQGKIRLPSFSQESAPPATTTDSGEVAVLRDRVLVLEIELHALEGRLAEVESQMKGWNNPAPYGGPKQWLALGVRQGRAESCLQSPPVEVRR